jgi:hypothetical protein
MLITIQYNKKHNQKFINFPLEQCYATASSPVQHLIGGSCLVLVNLA